MSYPTSIYDQTRPLIRSSAAAVVPVLYDLCKPETVVDVGCGEGHWLTEFEALGCTTVGLDANPTNRGDWYVCDLEQPIAVFFRADLVLCLEVAEHLSPGRADSLVAELVRLAPTVVLSAAIPGQGGAGHVNEQWPAYWVEKFAAHGYKGSGQLRRELWEDDRIAAWYRQNLLVFGDLGRLIEDGCPAAVHPDIWGWYR